MEIPLEWPLIFPASKTLRPFQHECIQQMLDFIRKRTCCYNAFEMGLGKTPQAIVCANSIGSRYVLVICPAVMRRTWENEIREWAPDAKATVVTKEKDISFVNAPGQAHYLIASYDFVARHAKRFANLYIALLILDEADYLKNRKSLRTKEILGKIWPRSVYRIALSGTPFSVSVADAYPMFNACDPASFPNFYSFAETYTNVKRTAWGDKYEGIKNAEQLKRITRSRFLVRRLKKDVLKELPPKVFQIIELGEEYKLTLTLEEKAAQKRFVEILKQSLVNGTTPPPPDVSVAELRRRQGEKKRKPVVDFVKSFLEKDIPIILFAWHKEVMRGLAEDLADYSPAIITGETSDKDRNDAVNNFQSGATNLFLGNIRAGGVGITLTRASHVAFAELDYSPSKIAQAADRAHRIGQKDSVNVYFLVVKDSLDSEVLKEVMKKMSSFEEALGDNDKQIEMPVGAQLPLS